MHLTSLLATSVVLLIFTICIPPAMGQVRPLKEKIRSGHELFYTYNCVNCHTTGGNIRYIGPDLSRMTVWASPILGAAVMWNHIPIMAKTMNDQKISWPNFKGEDITDIFTYLHSLNRQEGSIYSYRGQAYLGRELFISSGCQACHGSPFVGGGMGPDLGKIVWQMDNENEFATRMIRHAPKMVVMAKNVGIMWPRLTGNEIANIYAFLQTLIKIKRPISEK